MPSSSPSSRKPSGSSKQDRWVFGPLFDRHLSEYDMREAEASGLTTLRQGDVHVLSLIERLPDHPEFNLDTRFVVTSEGVTLAGIQIVPANLTGWPVPVVTVQLLRTLSLDRLYASARQIILNWPEHLSEVPEEWRDGYHNIQVDRDEFRRNRRPGRRGRDDLPYVRIANRYVHLVANSKKPIEDLARELHMSKSSASSKVHESRKRGLLSPAIQGKAGGQLTEKAIEILRSATDVGQEAR